MRYPAKLSKSDGKLVVTFRDIPEAVTQGDDEAEALAMALDVLVSSMDFYFEDRQPVPLPSKPKPGERLIDLPSSVAAKVLLLNEMLAQRVRPADLARRLHQKPQEMTRLLDLKHASKIDAIQGALGALGKELVLELRAA